MYYIPTIYIFKQLNKIYLFSIRKQRSSTYFQHYIIGKAYTVDIQKKTKLNIKSAFDIVEEKQLF